MKIEKPAAEVRQHVDLDALVQAVKQAHQAAEETHGDFLDKCREAGENLRRIKQHLKPKRGEWRRWVANNMPFSYPSAVRVHADRQALGGDRGQKITPDFWGPGQARPVPVRRHAAHPQAEGEEEAAVAPRAVLVQGIRPGRPARQPAVRHQGQAGGDDRPAAAARLQGGPGQEGFEGGAGRDARDKLRRNARWSPAALIVEETGFRHSLVDKAAAKKKKIENLTGGP